MGTDGRMEPQGHFGPFFSSSIIQFNFWLKKQKSMGSVAPSKEGQMVVDSFSKKGLDMQTLRSSVKREIEVENRVNGTIVLFGKI
jgi:hypothetical protein